MSSPEDQETLPSTSAAEPGQEVPRVSHVSAASVESANDAMIESSSGVMDLIMDIPVTLSMELGRTHISIRELLSLNPGSVIELERLASEPMQILVNGTLVAHGEAVKLGDRYGVRLTSVVSSAERLKHVSE